MKADNCNQASTAKEQTAKWYETNAKLSLDVLVYNIEHDTSHIPLPIASIQ